MARAGDASACCRAIPRGKVDDGAASKAPLLAGTLQRPLPPLTEPGDCARRYSAGQTWSRWGRRLRVRASLARAGVPKPRRLPTWVLTRACLYHPPAQALMGRQRMGSSPPRFKLREGGEGAFDQRGSTGLKSVALSSAVISSPLALAPLLACLALAALAVACASAA